MNESFSPELPVVLAGAFVIFLAVSFAISVLTIRDRVVEARLVSIASWATGVGIVVTANWALYGFAVVAPAAAGVGLAMLVLYMIARSVRTGAFAATIRVVAAAAAATMVLPLSLLLFLSAFGVDGP